MNAFVTFLASEQYAIVLLMLGIVTAIHRLALVRLFQYTIRSRWDNLLIALAMVGVTLYILLEACQSVPDETLHALNRFMLTWLLLVQLWTGHREISRLHKAREIYREAIAESTNGFRRTVEALTTIDEDVSSLK